MWRSLFMLWSVPLVVGLLMYLSHAKGTPAIGQKAWHLLTDFPENAQRLGAIALVPIGTVFFFFGLLQGLVFVNLGIAGTVAIPIAAGAAAIVLLPSWLRFVSRESRARHRAAHAARATHRTAPLRSH